MIDKRNILLVDDNRENLIVLSLFLKDQGFNIAIAFDGYTTIKIVNENKIDLILLDIMMPDIDGFQTIELLKSKPETSIIPVIFLTAKTRTEDITKGFQCGGSDYITKPYIKEELLARIRNHIEIKLYKEELCENIKKLSSAVELLDNLLLNVLPVDVAADFKRTGKSDPKTHRNATIFVCDFVNFTQATSIMKSCILFEELNDLYSGFDEIIEKNNCERIKTIGDGYLAVSGMFPACDNHANNIVESAIEIVKYLQQRNINSEHKWEVRIGINSGEITGGIVGTKKFAYDIFGSDVNIAFRLESLSEPMQINISEATHKLIISKYSFTERPVIRVKGINELKMYFINL